VRKMGKICRHECLRAARAKLPRTLLVLTLSRNQSLCYVLHTLYSPLFTAATFLLPKEKGGVAPRPGHSPILFPFVPAILHHTRAFQAVSYSLDSGSHYTHCRYTYWLMDLIYVRYACFGALQGICFCNFNAFSLHFFTLRMQETFSVNQCTITCTDVTLMYINSHILFSAYLQ